eukprot:4902316-Amphidinium_carterae.1
MLGMRFVCQPVTRIAVGKTIQQSTELQRLYGRGGFVVSNSCAEMQKQWPSQSSISWRILPAPHKQER